MLAAEVVKLSWLAAAATMVGIPWLLDRPVEEPSSSSLLSSCWFE